MLAQLKVWLHSVMNYLTILLVAVLSGLRGNKMTCLANRVKEKEDDSPIAVHFPNDVHGTHSCTTIYFSVYDGVVLYRSHFGRFILLSNC